MLQTRCRVPDCKDWSYPILFIMLAIFIWGGQLLQRIAVPQVPTSQWYRVLCLVIWSNIDYSCMRTSRRQ